ASGDQDAGAAAADAPPVPVPAVADRTSALAVTAAPRIRIQSPDSTQFVSGPTPIRATVEPDTDVVGVTFYIDGRQVCEFGAAPFECDWDAGRDVVAHQVRVVATLGGGGRVVRTMRTRGLGYADKVEVDAVQVTVTVTDGKGKFVPGIPQQAFHIYEDGQPQQIGYFASEDVPLELVVAVDISGSMTAAMPRLKRTVRNFLQAVPAGNQVTLLGFNDAVFTLTRRATDPAERVRVVDRLAPWGATALYDVIIRGVEMLGRQTGRRALVVFTDGEDQGSHVTLEDVERRLQASDVTLYMIGQGRGVTHDYLRKVMQRLTVPTGGRVFTTDNIDALQSAFEDLLEELSNQYLIGYQPTYATRDDSWHEIRVEIEGQPLNIRARQGYRAMPQK
ncbi:MAG: VWA domain-containing protein, partial [Vicinamibacterales bacterium]